jgi:type II secretory pathway pseudopilin PulG
VELLVVLPIAAIIGLAAMGTISQIIQSSHNSERIAALHQVQTAGYWISKDGAQAQKIVVSPGSGFNLTLTWTDWDDSETHQVEYSLQPVGSGGLCHLQRREVRGAGGADSAVTTVAQYIDPSGTNCTPEGRQLKPGEALIVTVTARVGQQTETRRYEIQPRALL